MIMPRSIRECIGVYGADVCLRKGAVECEGVNHRRAAAVRAQRSGAAIQLYSCVHYRTVLEYVSRNYISNHIHEGVALLRRSRRRVGRGKETGRQRQVA